MSLEGDAPSLPVLFTEPFDLERQRRSVALHAMLNQTDIRGLPAGANFEISTL